MAKDQPAVVAVVPPAGECECVLAVVALGVVLARGPLVGADGSRETGAARDGDDLWKKGDGRNEKFDWWRFCYTDGVRSGRFEGDLSAPREKTSSG